MVDGHKGMNLENNLNDNYSDNFFYDYLNHNDENYFIHQKTDDNCKLPEKETIPIKKYKRPDKGIHKPWMNYVNKYSLLSNKQKEALDLFFLHNQVKLTRKNLRTIASELKISYKKVVNYIYEKNYDHMLVNEMPEEKEVFNMAGIIKELEHSWEIYTEMARYFRDQMGLNYRYQ